MSVNVGGPTWKRGLGVGATLTKPEMTWAVPSALPFPKVENEGSLRDLAGCCKMAEAACHS